MTLGTSPNTKGTAPLVAAIQSLTGYLQETGKPASRADMGFLVEVEVYHLV